MISIKNTILIAVVTSLIISSALLTMQEAGQIDIFNKRFGDETRLRWEDRGPYISGHTMIENVSQGYYRTSVMYGLEPGRYRVNVEPVGTNITLYLIDGDNTTVKRFNESFSFEMDITTNTVRIGMIIVNPITFQEHKGERFVVTFHKEKEDSPLLVVLWAITIIGVIYVGVDTYRRKHN